MKADKLQESITKGRPAKVFIVQAETPKSGEFIAGYATNVYKITGEISVDLYPSIHLFVSSCESDGRIRKMGSQGVYY